MAETAVTLQGQLERTRPSTRRRMGRTFRRYPLATISLGFLVFCLFVAAFAPLIARHDPKATNGRVALQTPSAEYWFGTDRLGRDVFSRLVYGTRISVAVGLMAVVFAGSIGIPLGLASGYFGGWVDAVIMRLVDAVISIPGLLLALALILVLSPSFITVALALGIAAFPGYARLVRSRVLALRVTEFVTAARAIGAPDSRIMWRYLLPNALSPIIVVASLSMGGAVLAEAGLSFLGVGIRPPTPTWGSMLNDAYVLIYNAPWLMFFPGTAIFLLILSLNLLGDGLRDLLDPRQRLR